MCNCTENQTPHGGHGKTAAYSRTRVAMAVRHDCKEALPAVQDMPRSGIIDGVSNDVNMPLSVSPRLA